MDADLPTTKTSKLVSLAGMAGFFGPPPEKHLVGRFLKIVASI